MLAQLVVRGFMPLAVAAGSSGRGDVRLDGDLIGAGLHLVRDTPAMLRELKVVEQRYQAVLRSPVVVHQAEPDRAELTAV